ncbi:MAG: tetratricopeptide repeat protein [Proteobacteria bacterium]|nr:tetratricopeptide repeat protein [Pseudomonadota bacterium]
MHIRNRLTAYHLASFLLLFFLLAPYSRSFADSGHEPDIKPFMVIDADKQFEFAQHLFSNQKFSGAIAEFQRFIYFFPQDDRIELAMYSIGMAYFNSSRFKETVNSFQTLIDRYGETDLGIKSYLMISESHMQLNAAGPAIINLHNLITITTDKNVQDEAYYRLGWIYLETASWENARRYFSKISLTNADKYKLNRLSVDLDQEKFIPKKNPQLAGLLSVIPGAGHLYCERYQDALIAFLINGALIFAACESFDNDNPVLGGVIAFVEFGFYGGNIYGAVSGAHKYNRDKTGRFIENLKETHKLKLSAGFGKNRGGLALRFEF